MPLEFDIKLKAKDMFRFNMYQTYTSFSGWFSIIFSIALFGLGGYAAFNYGKEALPNILLYIGAGVFMLVYMPITLWLRAGRTIKASPVLSDTLHYHVDEDGFTVTQGEASGVLAWKQIYKMVATKHLVLVYSGRINAYVIPRKQLGEHYVTLAKVATSKLPKFRCRMKVTIKDV
ncbi:MAG: YcxB family protein [Roseburia sp.]|nr:YcxB family protein [Roseburia sp.]